MLTNPNPNNNPNFKSNPISDPIYAFYGSHFNKSVSDFVKLLDPT